MFHKLLKLTVVISSLVLVYGENKLPEEEVSNRLYARNDRSYKDTRRNERLHDGNKKKNAKYSESQSDEDSGEDIEIIKQRYEGKIKKLESKKRKLNIKVVLLQKKRDLLIRCKKNSAQDFIAEEMYEVLKNLLESESADSKFKYILGLELEKRTAEHTDVKDLKPKDIKKKFKLFPEPATWADAKEACNLIGMYLPVIHSEQEEKALKDMLKEKKPDAKEALEAWIGVYREKDEWLAISGEPLDSISPYVNWAPTQPDNSLGNEKCVGLYTTGGFNDLPCAEKRPYFCKHFIS